MKKARGEVHGADYLLGYLFEIGPTVAAGMGAGPIEWPHINAWCERIGIDLEPWESRFLRRLSLEYLSESHKAEKRDARAPWRLPEVSSEQKQKVAMGMRDYFRRMAADD